MVEEKCKRCFIKDVEYKCRTCFEPSGVIHELDWVFEDFSKEIVKLKNYSDDRLPNTMCSCCLDKLNISVTFITQIKVINEKYLKLLNESDITLDENGLKQADLNADCLEEHTIDMPVDHLCVQQIKLEEADEFNLAKITTTPEIYSEGNVIETEGTTRSDILKSDVPQRKLSADIPIYGSLKKEILKAQPQESSEDDDNSKYDENWEGHESSSDEETLSVTKKKIKLEKKSSAKNTKRNVELPPSNNKFDNIKKVNGRFVCLLCEKSFSDRKVCVRHISSIHLKENTFSCEFCGNNFHRKDNLTEHVKRMHSADSSMREQQSGGYSQTFKSSSAKIIQCGLCCKSFETLQLLRLHLPIHADGRTDIDLTNSIYIKRFEKSKNMDLTLLQHQIQSNFKRQQISRYYRALDKDGNEMDILDSETEDDDDAALGKTMVKYQCTLCTTPADFKRRKNLMAHQHENHSTAPLPFKCDDCAKEFISNCLLQQHMQRECADEFRKQARQCEHCEKRFIWPNNMTRHKEIQHKQQRQQRPQNTSNTLKCDFCDKTFLWPKDLARHRKIHVDGKKFSCPHCERKFQRKDNLKSHLRLVHDSQLIPDNTTAINKSNRTTDQILPHLVKPHGCKIIKCMICYTEFNKICDLRSHLKSHQVEIDLSRRMQGNEKISEISQQLYPEELPILAVEELQKKILHDIACNNNIERFYSITNEHGYEIHLDSSETESDSEEETELNEIEKINCKRFYNCDNCTDVSFTRKYQLFDHQQKMHSWEDASHSCVHCNARFLSSYLLQLHYKRQCKNSIKKFFCKQCPLRFMWKNNLVAHTTMDHAINLKKESHPNIHSSTELHYCLLCPITFYNNQHLNKHLLEIHHLTESDIKRVETLLHSSCWPNEEKKIECKLCLMKFQTMHELRQHQSISLNSNSICHAVEHSVRNYSIVNKKGFELNLELDSETDNDDDQEDDIEQHQTETMNSDLCSSKPYLCALCNWSSKRKYQMMQHQRSHHDYNETLQWKCENCLFSSVCERILDYHKRTQCFNLDKEFQCHHCNIKFMWPENLESHVLVFHAPSNCSKTDTLNIASEIQLSPTTNNIFECMDCHKQYNSIIRYRAHFQKFHNPNNKTTLSHKQRKSQTKQAAIHSISSKKNIEKNSLCPFCGVSFSNNSKFVIHLRRHTGEKPYKCDLCEKGFPRSTDLQAHRRSHTGEKPYKCSSCDKSFSQHNKLRIHNRTHTGERPYHCTFCEKTFKQSSVLTLHLRRHTGETPYVCGTCGKGYVCSAALKKHQNSKGHLAAEAHNGDAVVNITDYQSNLDCEYSSQY